MIKTRGSTQVVGESPIVENLQKQIQNGYKEFKTGKAIPARAFLKTLKYKK